AREPVWNAVRVAGREYRDPHWLSRAIHSSVADQGPGRKIFHRQYRCLPGERGPDVEQTRRRVSFGHWRDVTIDGMTRPDQALPGVVPSIGHRSSARQMQERRIHTRARKLGTDALEHAQLIFCLRTGV